MPRCLEDYLLQHTGLVVHAGRLDDEVHPLLLVLVLEKVLRELRQTELLLQTLALAVHTEQGRRKDADLKCNR